MDSLEEMVEQLQRPELGLRAWPHEEVHLLSAGGIIASTSSIASSIASNTTRSIATKSAGVVITRYKLQVF
jgi:hypothetical protein